MFTVVVRCCGFRCSHALLVLICLAGSLLSNGQTESKLPAEMRQKIDRAAQDVLAQTGVPSASIAVVQGGEIAYVQAYGSARLKPSTPAKPGMRYSIGSISKQFTSAAVLLLMEEGKLSLDDPVGKYVPNLTRANEVTIRQLLSHTSGYQDYWPQDYVPPFMTHPITSDRILDLWARKALDFDPGTQWQYSNTNYVIAGVIVEKVSGQPLLTFLNERVFAPVGMQRVENIDLKGLGPEDATGYMRYALGPLRVAPKEGPGWLFAAGELAMPANELAKWDISMLRQQLLKPASYKEMETEVRLKNGSGTGYALGLQTGNIDGHRVLRHGGEVSGYTASNMIFPDDNVAMVVLTNQDAISASGSLARRIADLLLASNAGDARKLQESREIFSGLQHGKIDRSRFTENANAYFTPQALLDFASSLGPLGEPREFVQTAEHSRGGMILRAFKVTFPGRTVSISTFEMPDGKLEQYQVSAEN